MTPQAKQFKVGDIITAYHKGYHRITLIEDRQQSNTGRYKGTDSPLIHYTCILDSNGQPSKARKNECDALYCRRVTTEQVLSIYDEGIKLFVEKKANLLKAIEGLSETTADK